MGIRDVAVAMLMLGCEPPPSEALVEPPLVEDDPRPPAVPDPDDDDDDPTRPPEPVEPEPVEPEPEPVAMCPSHAACFSWCGARSRDGSCYPASEDELDMLDRAGGEQGCALAFNRVALRAQVTQLALVFPRFFEQLKPLLLQLGSPAFELLDIGGAEGRQVTCRT